MVVSLQDTVVGLLLMTGCVQAFAQVVAQISGPTGIYTCVDASGRRLTADRPIKECVDRAQRELGPSGTVRRTIGPSLTAEERAIEEDKARKAAEERSRANEERRRERALLARYPDRAAHDKERQSALSQVDLVIRSADVRTTELVSERKRL